MKGVCFHHDNAHTHNAHGTANLLAQFRWNILTHPLYSTDLPPSDFHLFPELKSHLSGTQFQTDELLPVQRGRRVL